ncbi:MAG: hypothetical protein QGG40_00405, partial [Myxococcota bacterium]|nr:hypothetical protein [Myxococcota bacterium]
MGRDPQWRSPHRAAPTPARWLGHSLPRVWLALLAAMLVYGSEANGAGEPDPWTVTVQLTTPPTVDLRSPQLTVRWLGQTHRVPLDDQGTNGDDQAGDQTWTAQVSGSPIRYLPIRIRAATGDHEPQLVYQGVEVLTYGDQTVNLTVAPTESLLVVRTSTPADLDDLASSDATVTATSLGWLVVCLVVVLGLAGSVRRQEEHVPSEPYRRPSAWPWLLLASAWTWPALLSGPGRMVGRHFDLPGTLWTLGSADRLVYGLEDTLTAWPWGADYTALDSYLMVPLGWFLQSIDPVRLHGLLQVLGVAVCAWMAECFATTLGARRPWSLLAGLSFGFSGLAANALLEGHVYHVLDPWLPGFAWAWWRATSPDGRVRHGLLAGAAFAATLFTTGYLGMAAAVIAVGF